MNHLIVCNTPYQIFNVINILANDVEIMHFDTDVLIDESFDSFKNAKEIGERIFHFDLCRNVFYGQVIKQLRPRLKIETLMYLKCKDHTKEYTFSDKEVLNIPYNTVWVGDTNYLGSSLIQRNKGCKAIWYDDGLSSYSASPRGFGINKSTEKIIKMLRIGSYGYRPEKLYVNNVLFTKANDFNIKQLPAFKDNNPAVNFIKKVFDYKHNASVINTHNYIFLGQLYSSLKGYNGLSIETILRLLVDHGIDVIIRKHPRDNCDYKNYVVDTGINMWELECIENISNSHVLIACCSTAQVSPKLLCGKEPYLLFLYKLLLDESSPLRVTYDGIVESIADMYSDRKKICIPRNMEELIDVMNEIKK